jgi:hypothetical protein
MDQGTSFKTSMTAGFSGHLEQRLGPLVSSQSAVLVDEALALLPFPPPVDWEEVAQMIVEETSLIESLSMSLASVTLYLAEYRDHRQYAELLWRPLLCQRWLRPQPSSQGVWFQQQLLDQLCSTICRGSPCLAVSSLPLLVSSAARLRHHYGTLFAAGVQESGALQMWLK